MVKITPSGVYQTQFGKSNKTKRSGSSFSIGDGEGASESSKTGSAGASDAVQGIDALLMLQAVEERRHSRKQQIEYGHDLLDDLEALKIDILSGRLSRDRLNALIGKLVARQNSGDAKLDALIDDIELRARVELAKLEKA